jgi:hypothetical protein
VTLTLAFTLKVPGRDEFRDFRAVSTSFRCEGRLTLEGEALTIEWGGEARVQEVGLLTLADDRVTMPDEWLTVSVGELDRATLEGGWWRPRLALFERRRGALAAVPSASLGAVQCWIARRDRDQARTFAAALTDVIATLTPTLERGPP